MRTEYLIYFLETVKAGSLNKASQLLGVTHQTISTGMTNLENELDVGLLIRDKQGITLTPAGAEAVAFAQKILEDTEQFKGAMAAFKTAASAKEPAGHLDVLYTPLINIWVIPYLTGPFLKAYPQITLHFTEMEGVEILKALQNKKGDLGIFALSSAIRSNKALCAQAKTLSPDNLHLCAVVAAHHPLAKRKSISVKTLLKYPLAIYQVGEESGSLQNLLRSYGEPKLALVTSNLVAYERHIASGQAVGFLPKIGKKAGGFGFRESADNLVFIPIKEAAAYPVAYAVSPELSQVKADLCQLFIDEVKAMF